MLLSLFQLHDSQTIALRLKPLGHVASSTTTVGEKANIVKVRWSATFESRRQATAKKAERDKSVKHSASGAPASYEPSFTAVEGGWWCPAASTFLNSPSPELLFHKHLRAGIHSFLILFLPRPPFRQFIEISSTIFPEKLSGSPATRRGRCVHVLPWIRQSKPSKYEVRTKVNRRGGHHLAVLHIGADSATTCSLPLKRQKGTLLRVGNGLFLPGYPPLSHDDVGSTSTHLQPTFPFKLEFYRWKLDLLLVQRRSRAHRAVNHHVRAGRVPLE